MREAALCVHAHSRERWATRQMKARSWSASAPAADDARYQIERKLGEGGAGAVYLVRDRETGEQLALKKLFRVDAKSVLRLKREFRALQAVNHPHIIKLYDMGQAADSWFLTMEYLDGADLTTYLSTSEPATDGAPSSETTSTPTDVNTRLVSAFRQLARGIKALHEAGMLHRDLKPNNVLVVDHRVVVLDFGLVRELSVSAATVSEDGAVAGTPAYMAPEQILGNELSAASDWYAFGVMLYEAVSGLLPVEGSLLQLLRAKLESDPIPLEQLVPDVPLWLNALCMGLLRREPLERPSGDAILAALDAALPQPALPATSTETLLHTDTEAHAAPSQLFGRASETKQLWDALAEAENGRSIVVYVRGASGTGKSALVEHFLDEVELAERVSNSSDALVLRSRCYELEAMPFKALDGVIDALMRHLSRLDDLDVAHMLPADVTALARVFPVLERLKVVKRLLSMSKPIHDALQTRHRAEAALGDLLDNLAARAPIVLWIDDLQWGDLDSARILKRWILQPSASPIMFVFSYRSDEVATSTCLCNLLQRDAEHASAGVEHTIDVALLGPADMQALCEPRLSLRTPRRAELIERIVHEAQGSPFLASQLIALAEVKSLRGDTDLHTLSLDLMVAQTSAMLADDAKKLLVLLAVAGRPMPPKVALQAAGVKRGGRALVHDLRGLNLVRTRDVGGERMLEVYHDRVRERVQSALSIEESLQIHRSLFNTLEFSSLADPDWLHVLALGAGQTAQALEYGNAAAVRANASLAFERAATLYRKCIELVSAAQSGELWSNLAWALARCGRGVEAAEACLQTAQHVPPHEHAEWIQRAASHFLRSGHFAQGDALVRKVLEANEIDVPESEAGLLAAIVWERTCIKLRGTNDTLRVGRNYPCELLERFDLLTSLLHNTQSYDPLRAALFQARALRCALEAGEPLRLVRALCSASTAAAFYGSAQAARDSDALLARAASINAKMVAPDDKTLCVARAINAFMLGRPHDVLEPAREAERLFRADSQDDPSGNYFRRFAVAAVRMGALELFGEYAEVDARLRSLLNEGAATDNRGLLLQLTLLQTHNEQNAGHAAWSRPRLEAQRAQLPDNCFGALHVLHMVAVMGDACWRGDYASAEDYVDGAWARFLRSPVRRAAYLGCTAHGAHARFLLNQYVAQGRPGDPARAALKAIDALEKLPMPFAAATAQSYRARVAFLAGHPQQASTLLRASATGYETLGMPHEMALNQYALGTLLPGDEGAALCSAAEQRLRALGVADPTADVRAHYPELIAAG